jgi:phosphoribosylaminoimidazole-succinocarboxamide synthase
VAAVSALLGFFPWYAGLARGGVAQIGQVQLIQPLLTLAWSALLLGEHVGVATLVASIAVLASVVATQRTRVNRKQSASLGNVGPVSEAPALEHLSSGKVRDIYAVGEDRLLLVASDRISTYDVVHPTPIPDKGKVLTGLTAFWLERTGGVCPNHLISVTDVPEDFRGRAMLVERLEMVQVECVVRGYITGSGWKDYQASGAVCGIELPDGLRESEQLPEPIFTPATKAEVGDHDENVDFDRAAEIIGDRALLEELRRLSIAVYELGAAHAREHGIILADTKFEFGRRADGTIVLGDEVLTPDSSRFWPAEGYEPGHGQPSFDKQYVRDWASGSGWDKTPPAPALPDDVIARTRELYVDAYERITGEPFEAWLERSA